ncbi:hypothetical protein [Tepidibacter aestuarii]|nr:hypothetical protein [Tepidibacter aestuarii]
MNSYIKKAMEWIKNIFHDENRKMIEIFTLYQELLEKTLKMI